MSALRRPLPQHRRRDDRSLRFAFAFSAFLISSCALFAQSVPLSRPSDSPNGQPSITVRDATPIHLRFAEQVCGAAPERKNITAKQGAVVRMVVTRDLRLGDKVVIAKGALAQASVEKVLPARSDHRRRFDDPTYPGVSLQLDWVTTVTGDRATLRGKRKGPAKGVEYYVDPTRSGADVKPMLIGKGVSGFMRRTESAFTFAPGILPHGNSDYACIPDGARMVAYFDGDLSLSAEELEKAQSTLPAQSTDAILYIFRLKEKKKELDVAPSLVCNQIEIGALAPQQMAIANLPPGNYSCRFGNQRPIEIGVWPGMEYYGQLHRSHRDIWSIGWLNPEAGEDLSADIEVIQVGSANSPHP